jgi:phosphate:Na+ symporter
MSDFLAFLLGGLVLFLYSISQLSDVLKGIFNERAIAVIENYTSNIFYALFWGTLMTIVLGSSSAVIILVIIFINAQSLSFNQAIGLIMGANIGTTFSSQLISLDISEYALYPLILGLMTSIFAKKGKVKNTGKVMLYFGMLFFGLFMIESSVDPLK